MGEGKQSCCRAPLDKGPKKVHNGHFHIVGGIVVRGGRRLSAFQPTLHMSQRTTFSCRRTFVRPDTVYHQRGDWPRWKRLRINFVLKTDSGYLRDAEVT